MSGRTVLQFTLAGLLAATFAAPAAAHEPLPEAPMPREKIAIPTLGPIGLALDFPLPPPRSDNDNRQLFNFAVGLFDEPPVAPMPREKKPLRIEIEFHLGPIKVLETATGSFLAPSAAKPHEAAAQPPCCGGCCCRKPAARQMGDVVSSICGYDFEVLWPSITDRGPAAPMAQPAPPCVPAAPAPIPHYSKPSTRDIVILRQLVHGDGLHMPQPVPPQFFTAPVPPPCFVPAGMTGGTGPRPVPPAVIHRYVAGPNVVAVKAIEVCPPCPFPQAAPNPLLGTWYRSVGSWTCAVTFTHDEMKLRVSGTEGDKKVCLTATAHYTLTKDGLVYGAVTGVDAECGRGDKDDALDDFAEQLLVLQRFIDCPFSFRVKMTSAGMMVSHMKVMPTKDAESEMFAILGGLYKSAKDGRAPAPAPPKANAKAPAVGLPGTPYPLPHSPAGRCDPPAVERIGVDFNVIVPAMGQPAPPCVLTPLQAMIAPPAPCAPAPMPPPARPVGCAPVNDAQKQMACDAFNELLQQSGVIRARGMTLPPPQYIEHVPQYLPPAPCVPLANANASVAPAKPTIVGTWHRELGSKRCVVAIEADHLTITVSEAHEIDGKAVTGHLILTADYHLTRDGLTAVGLITNVDVKCDGELPEDEAGQMMERLGEVQKFLEDKPFAMTCRLYGDTLVIGSVRMPTAGGRMDAEPGTYVGGRYARMGDKPLPKLKPVKACEPKPLPAYVPGPYTLPVPDAYGAPMLPAPGVMLPPGPVYPCPVPTGNLLPPQALTPACAPMPRPHAGWQPAPTKVPRELNKVTVPPGEPLTGTTPAVIPASEAVPSMTEPTRPETEPQMPEPAKPGKKQKKQKYSIEPNVRTQQLLQQSEDLRQIQNAWRRFWFNDLPSQLTPERVHGGIY